MTKANLPRIRFSQWAPWANRKELECSGESGVYMMAIFQGSHPTGSAAPTAPEVVYVGETGRPMVKRWQTFERSARTGDGGHAGGNTFHKSKPGRLPFIGSFASVGGRGVPLSGNRPGLFPICSAIRSTCPRHFAERHVPSAGRPRFGGRSELPYPTVRSGP